MSVPIQFENLYFDKMEISVKKIEHNFYGVKKMEPNESVGTYVRIMTHNLSTRKCLAPKIYCKQLFLKIEF